MVNLLLKKVPTYKKSTHCDWISFSFEIYLFLLYCVSDLPHLILPLFACIPHSCLICGGQKKAVDLLGLKFQGVVSCLVDPGPSESVASAFSN